MSASVVLAAILAIYPHARSRECLRLRADRISMGADAAARERGIPVQLLMAVGFFESRLGCDRASGGSWGSPIDRNHRGVAGTPWHTARDLETSLRVCGGATLRAVSRFRCGLCSCRGVTVVGYTPRDVVDLVDRIERRVSR